nr:WD40 repeat protein Ciao1 [Cryptococcus depauperatus CBS 7855]
MSSLELIDDLPSHSEPAWTVAFNPVRSFLASCSTDRTIRLFSYILPEGDGNPVFSLFKVIETNHKRTVRSIGWTPDGKTLASGSFDSTVGVWEEVIPEDASVEEPEGVYQPLDDNGTNMGEKEWECVTTLEGHESECKSVAFSSDGALLASCSRDKSVWVWEVQEDSDFECIAVMMEHTQDVKCIAWHPHEEILASASYDSHIHLAFDDPESDWYEALHVPPLEEDETIWSLAWSPCGRFLASGGDNGGIRLWQRTTWAYADLNSGSQSDSSLREIIHTAAHSRSVFSLSWSPSPSPNQGNLGLLVSGGGDGKLIVWSLSSDEVGRVEMKPIAAVKGAHGVSDVNSVGWCVREDGKGKGMLSSAGDDGSVKVWRLV